MTNPAGPSRTLAADVYLCPFDGSKIVRAAVEDL
jgi:hypothetical protein